MLNQCLHFVLKISDNFQSICTSPNRRLSLEIDMPVTITLFSYTSLTCSLTFETHDITTDDAIINFTWLNLTKQNQQCLDFIQVNIIQIIVCFCKCTNFILIKQAQRFRFLMSFGRRA